MSHSLLSAKRKIGALLSNGSINRFFVNINLILFHWNERGHWVRKDNAADKKFYVIRSRSNLEGLISIYFYVAYGVKIALENGFIPVIDLRTNNQYLEDHLINGTDNAWEYYFEQPSGYTMNDLRNEKNIFYDGWQFHPKYTVDALTKKVDDAKYGEIRSFCNEHLRINQHVLALAEEKYSQLLGDYKGHVLGVFMRGTDYVALAPAGHCIQPSVEMVIDKTREYLRDYDIRKIFFVTEDYEYYQKYVEAFGDLVITSDNYFVKEYSGKKYLADEINIDPYTKGLQYLIRLIILSKCDYLIAGQTNGSIFARCFMQNEPKSEYWFDIGLY